jgi:hypothetical protein
MLTRPRTAKQAPGSWFFLLFCFSFFQTVSDDRRADDDGLFFFSLSYVLLLPGGRRSGGYNRWFNIGMNWTFVNDVLLTERRWRRARRADWLKYTHTHRHTHRSDRSEKREITSWKLPLSTIRKTVQRIERGGGKKRKKKSNQMDRFHFMSISPFLTLRRLILLVIIEKSRREILTYRLDFELSRTTHSSLWSNKQTFSHSAILHRLSSHPALPACRKRERGLFYSISLVLVLLLHIGWGGTNERHKEDAGGSNREAKTDVSPVSPSWKYAK